jgi:hypothetical protein
MIALEPPGNVARDLALFRRELFSRLGEPSALAFPEIVPLAFAATAVGLAARELSGCWKGIGGSFSSAAPVLSGGLLYLALSGPLEELRARAQALLARGLSPIAEQPLATGIGVFLCRPVDPGRALAEAECAPPPRLSFRDCSLTLYGLGFGAASGRGPFAALRWRELARAGRRSRDPGSPAES